MSVIKFICLLDLSALSFKGVQEKEATYVFFDSSDEFSKKKFHDGASSYTFFNPVKKKEKEELIRKNDPRAATMCDHIFFRVYENDKQPIRLDTIDYLNREELIALTKQKESKIDLHNVWVIEKSGQGYVAAKAYFDPCI